MPLIRGYNDSYDAITGAFDYVIDLAKKSSGRSGDSPIKRIDVLPYHQMGKKKYEMLGWDYPIAEHAGYKEEELKQLEQFFKNYDFDIRVVRN